MTQIKTLVDKHGVIYEASKILPDNQHRVQFIEALAELEDNERHRTRTFPKTRLHRITGIRQAVYRADINKVSGWRLHIQYIDGQIHLKDVIEGQKHDKVLKIIKSKKRRYE